MDAVAEALGKKIAENLVATQHFTFIPAVKGVNAQNPQFLENKRVQGTLLFDVWELKYSESRRWWELFLTKDGALVCTLSLVNTGIWRGRDRSNNGTVLLRPREDTVQMWMMLSDPTKFAKTMKVDDAEPAFHYHEPLPPQIPWAQYPLDLKASLTVPVAPVSQTAIALLACDRPDYFKKVVDSCVRNPDFGSYPVFGFFDKPEEVKRESQREEQIDYLLKACPNAVIIKRPRNFGCGRNIIDARRQLFDRLGYRRVFVLEDDMILSSTYFQYVTNLFNWADANYSNVGAVQGWSWCKLIAEDRPHYANAVKSTYSNWWGYCLSKRAWDAMSPMIYKYEDLFLGGEYKLRPHLSIRKWFRMKMERPIAQMGTKPYPAQPDLKAERKNYFDEPPTGQDAVTMHAFELTGMVRLCPVVNRGQYIGKYGIHMTPRIWVANGYDRLIHVEYPEDAHRKEFTLVQHVPSAVTEPPESPVAGMSYREK